MNVTPRFSRKHHADFLLGSNSLSVITRKPQAALSPKLSFVGAGWVHNTGTELKLPSFVEPVQVLFAHQTPAVVWSFVSWKPRLSQAWADQARRTKTKYGLRDKMQERVERRWISGKTGPLVSPGQWVQDYLQKVKEAKEENAKCVVLLAKQAQPREFLLTSVYCQLTGASNHWFGCWEKEAMNN